MSDPAAALARIRERIPAISPAEQRALCAVVEAAQEAAEEIRSRAKQEASAAGCRDRGWPIFVWSYQAQEAAEILAAGAAWITESELEHLVSALIAAKDELERLRAALLDTRARIHELCAAGFDSTRGEIGVKAQAAIDQALQPQEREG